MSQENLKKNKTLIIWRINPANHTEEQLEALLEIAEVMDK